MMRFPTESGLQAALHDLMLSKAPAAVQPREAYKILAEQFKLPKALRVKRMDNSDEILWENLVRFARRKLVHAGIVDPGEHGGWSLASRSRSKVWIEKSLVSGRVDRSVGDNAVGRALWSPIRSQNGSDIYRNMRFVQENDVVLHLTDNAAFTGVSVASGSAHLDFKGVEETIWAGLPCYRVGLRDFVKLDPSLTREELVATEENRAQLGAIRQRFSNLFYDPNLNLHQGGYLTEAPDELVAFLDRIYEARTGRPISYVSSLLSPVVGALSEKNAPIFNENTTRRVWLYAPGEQAAQWDEFYKRGIAAIGWDELGDLGTLTTRDAISAKMNEVYGEGQSRVNASQCFDFAHRMHAGDWIFVKKGRRQIVGFGVVESAYRFDDSRKEHLHVRKVDWQKTGLWSVRERLLPMKTLTEITRETELVEELSKLLEEGGEAQGRDPITTSSEEEISDAIEQRPAAYRFAYNNGKIYPLPESAKASDDAFASDSYEELKSKARGLLVRLRQSNSAAGVIAAVDALLASLGDQFGDLRPGVILSRMRTLEAQARYFDTEEGRSELLPDALAAIDTVVQTVHDLLAAFPIVREIEKERLALALETSPPVLEATAAKASEVQSYASKASEVVAAETVKALGENDEAIEQAPTLEAKANLLADKLLVVRNFAGATVSAIGRELRDLGRDAWKQTKDNLPIGIGHAARIGPSLALVGLATSIFGTIAGLSGLVHGFKPIAKKLGEHVLKQENVESNKNANVSTIARKHDLMWFDWNVRHPVNTEKNVEVTQKESASQLYIRARSDFVKDRKGAVGALVVVSSIDPLAILIDPGIPTVEGIERLSQWLQSQTALPQVKFCVVRFDGGSTRYKTRSRDEMLAELKKLQAYAEGAAAAEKIPLDPPSEFVISTAWQNLEKKLRTLTQRADLPDAARAPLDVVVEYLVSRQRINRATANTILDLYKLRREAVHNPGGPALTRLNAASFVQRAVMVEGLVDEQLS